MENKRRKISANRRLPLPISPLVESEKLLELVEAPEDQKNESKETFGNDEQKNESNTSVGDHESNRVREILSLFREEVVREKSKSEVNKKDKRVDLAAAGIVKEKLNIKREKPRLGAVPGVDIGDKFHYRAELALAVIHRTYQSGIDYANDGKDFIAFSIVASGGYNDDVKSDHTLVYSGQGGNPSGKDKPAKDQTLVTGNLALKNSIAARNPIRVVRGSNETKANKSTSRGKSVNSYVYDGLYTVEKYWKEMGPHRNLVYKFELKRMPSQQELAWEEEKNSKKVKLGLGVCANDISGGKELFPVCAINTIDNEKPPPFTYITSMIYPDDYSPIIPKGCDCKRACVDSKKCSCAVKNGGELPFNRNRGMVKVKPLIYECGPSCRCPKSCCNRVSQLGIKIQLEIFKTDSRGWGVRSKNSISSGQFVCEYIGKILDDKEADQRIGSDEYLFDIGYNLNEPNSGENVEEVGYTIDAEEFGNIGRFINHSCSPNLYAQNVIYDNEDKRIPHVMFFATENISPMQELTYDYNYAVNEVPDSDGNIKKKRCSCGSAECTGWLY